MMFHAKEQVCKVAKFSCTLCVSLQSLREIIYGLKNQIRSKIQNHFNSSTFTLVGVSFPAIIVLELSAMDFMIIAILSMSNVSI